MAYKPGDFWRIDDNSGFKVRSSRTARQWDGLISTDPDIRNPQDFVRGRKDHQNVPDPRPDSATAADVFITIEPVSLSLLTEGGEEIMTEDGIELLTEES